MEGVKVRVKTASRYLNLNMRAQEPSEVGDIITIPGDWYADGLIADGHVELVTEKAAAAAVPATPSQPTLSSDRAQAGAAAAALKSGSGAPTTSSEQAEAAETAEKRLKR